MKFDWQYRYVPEGQLEPDEHGRWAVDCSIFVNVKKALPKYNWYAEAFEDDYMPVRIATIHQKGTAPGVVPSLIHRFCACVQSFHDAGNLGFTTERYIYSNDVEELKKMVEEEYLMIQAVFMNCK